MLLNKVTFPGGKIEEGESLVAAASRELREETGVVVEPHQWQLFDSVFGDDYELHKLVAVSDKVGQARQLEEEPVWLLDCAFHASQARIQPSAYAHDFLPTLDAALFAANLQGRRQSHQECALA